MPIKPSRKPAATADANVNETIGLPVVDPATGEGYTGGEIPDSSDAVDTSAATATAADNADATATDKPKRDLGPQIQWTQDQNRMLIAYNRGGVRTSDALVAALGAHPLFNATRPDGLTDASLLTADKVRQRLAHLRRVDDRFADLGLQKGGRVSAGLDYDALADVQGIAPATAPAVQG